MLKLIILAKEPSPGTVKTRLIPALGADGAAALHRAFVADLLADLSPRPGLHLTLATTPDEDCPELLKMAADRDVRTVPQGDGDLGARMGRALLAGLAADTGPVVLIGSDAPTLPFSHLEAAMAGLTRAPVTLGPTLDGGYYLVGLAPMAVAEGGHLLNQLFARVDWGTDRVLRQTLGAANARGIAVDLGPSWYDVDEPSDLALLDRHLAAGVGRSLPATAALRAVSPPAPMARS